MRSSVTPIRPPRPDSSRLAAALAERIAGQPAAIEAIAPFITLYEAGLAPDGRPAGIFLLLGPTGTGKTRTVEALAEIIHGSARNVLRIDCGEYQLDHEVAKLIGAPPGYLGHRETQPMLSQAKLQSVASEQSALAIVLFDEIEKAAPSLVRLLLGVLDRAVLRLGDNTTVDFQRSLIFLTSNLGAEGMARLSRQFGLERPVLTGDQQRQGHRGVTGRALRKAFPPEFLNRIDATITYEPLDAASLQAILDRQLDDLQDHLDDRLGYRSFDLTVDDAGRALLLRLGTSPEFGARELKRTIQRRLMQPLAGLLTTGRVPPGSEVRVRAAAEELYFEVRAA